MTTPQAPDLDRTITSAPVPMDAPVMFAWSAYAATDEFANALRWAAHAQHAKGSLWAAFSQGFWAAVGKLETSEAAGIVEGWKERALAAEARASALQGEVDGLREAVLERVRQAYIGGCCAALTWTNSGVPKDHLEKASYDYVASLNLTGDAQVVGSGDI